MNFLAVGSALLLAAYYCFVFLLAWNNAGSDLRERAFILAIFGMGALGAGSLGFLKVRSLLRAWRKADDDAWDRSEET